MTASIIDRGGFPPDLGVRARVQVSVGAARVLPRVCVSWQGAPKVPLFQAGRSYRTTEVPRKADWGV
eukprot:589645-Lingulodinium_polyedra.AAC.1